MGGRGERTRSFAVGRRNYRARTRPFTTSIRRIPPDEAVETLAREVPRVLEAAETAGYAVVLTADHGNCQ